MKKTNVILSAVALCGAFASTALAGSIISSTTIGGGTYAPSTKVGVSLVSLRTSYGATSMHLNGTIQYGTVGGTGVTGDPTKIMSKPYTSATTSTVGIPETPTALALTGTGWN